MTGRLRAEPDFQERQGGVRRSLEGVLDRIHGAQRVLEPWDGQDITPNLPVSREQLRRSLIEVKEVLLRLDLDCGAEARGELPPEVGARVREISGRLHEGLWLASQAARRAASVATELGEARRRGAEIEIAVHTVRAMGRRTTALVYRTSAAA